MVGATVLGVFLQSLPPDRRVAMARVASLIRRAARGVRESKRFGLVFYELNGGPLFALESREKSLTLYVAEKSVIDPFIDTIKGFDPEHSLINFNDLNRLPLPTIEKLVRASVVARRERGTTPTQAEVLKLWGVEEEDAESLLRSFAFPCAPLKKKPPRPLPRLKPSVRPLKPRRFCAQPSRKRR